MPTTPIFIPAGVLADPLDADDVIRVDRSGKTMYTRVEEFASDPAFAGQFAPLAGNATISAVLDTARTSAVDVLFIGDSITEGAGSTADATLSTRWCQLVVDNMRQACSGGFGGRGYIPAYLAMSGYSGAEFAQAGDVTEDTVSGLGRRAAVLGSTGSAGKLTIDVTGTAVDVVYSTRGPGGTFTVKVDGVTEATQSAAYDPYETGGRKVRVAFDARDTYTIEIAHSAGNDVYIEGMMVYDGDETKGVRLWDGASSGLGAQNFEANQTWQWSLQAPVPDLVFIALGTNDFRADSTAANYGSDMAAIIDRIRTENVTGGADICPDVPIILVHLPEPVDGSYTPTWASYLAQLQSVAAGRDDVFVIDVSAYIPGGASTVIGDGLHPDAAGHAAIANIVSRSLLDGYSIFRVA